MRQKIIFPSLVNRITHRSNLLMVLLVGVLLDGFRIFINPSDLRWGELVFPFIFLFLQVALAPVPWLWQTPGKPRWYFVRRFLTALVFNVIWVGLGLTTAHYLTPFHGRHVKPMGENKSAVSPMPPMGGAPGGRPERPDDFRPEAFKHEGPEELPPGPPKAFHHGQGPRPRIPFFPEVSLGLLNVAFALIFGWETAEKELTEARERKTAKLLRQSQSKALRNQLDPHVLYNALNGLSELIHEDPLAAEETVALLANLYRTLTDYGRADMVHLSEERNLVEAYLSMEQMRLGERLRVEWDWPSWADEIQAPPLFLQPLVENAIKHGISSRDEGGLLRIACQREGQTLALQVSNTGLPPTASERKGVGLANIEARLGLWTDVSGSFSLRREGEWTIARVEWTPRSSI